MTRSPLLVGAGFVAALAGGWLVLPGAMYRPVQQPLSFSHEAHTGPNNGMACEDCHGFDAEGNFAGVPKLETCAGCHAEPLGETDAERVFVTDYVKTGREPEWARYSRQPDNAWFPHSTHVKLAGLACEECHADHGHTKGLRPVEVNRVSGYSRALMTGSGGLRMDDCVRCHGDKGLQHSCLDCHR